MRKIGFIGAGSMGGMLIDGFLREGVAASHEIVVTTGSERSRQESRKRWLGVLVAESNQELARECDLIFICVKPMGVGAVLDEIVPHLHQDAHLVSVAACVMLSDMTARYPGAVSRVIPSLTAELNTGVSLVCHNDAVSDIQQERLRALLSAVSRVEELRETDFEVGANLTSSAPGMFAALFESFVQAGVKHGNLPEETVERMVIETVLGTARLLTEKNIGFREMMSRVATKGGITEAGITCIQATAPAMFDAVFTRTLEKYSQINAAVAVQFAEKKKKE